MPTSIDATCMSREREDQSPPLGAFALDVAEGAGVARPAGVALADGTGVDARVDAGDGLVDPGDGVGVGDADALCGVTLTSASF
jgi:hypothetical protein